MQKPLHIIAFPLFVAFLLSAAFLLFTIAGRALADDPIGQKAHSTLIDNQGKVIGEARYIEGNEGILITIKLAGLPAGKHGMHFHEIGDCDDHSQFKMSGGHIMPSQRPHGFLHPQGPHEGNLPNLIIAENGTAHIELYSELLSLYGHKNRPALLDDNGSALIIHADEDDHKTQPIGGSGSRIACGVVRRIHE